MRWTALVAAASIAALVIIPRLFVETDPPTSMSTYFGTTHSHTATDNDHGNPKEPQPDAETTFASAQEQGFDFFFLTEHTGPTGPSDPNRFWRASGTAADLANVDGKFAAFSGYEYSDNWSPGGHLTGFGTGTNITATRESTWAGFYDEFLADDLAPGSLIGFNHPPAQGHPASRVEVTPERRARVVMSETSNGPVEITDSRSLALEAGYYNAWIAALEAGWRVAPTCGLDGHGLYRIELKESATKKTCRTGVLATELTRWRVLNALWHRRMFSTTDTNLDVRYQANQRWMGAEIGSPEVVAFDIDVEDPDTAKEGDRISKIDIVGDGGAVLASRDFSAHQVSWNPTVPPADNAYMFVRVFTAERPQPTALAAPVWLS